MQFSHTNASPAPSATCSWQGKLVLAWNGKSFPPFIAPHKVSIHAHTVFTHITWAAVLGAVHLFFLYNCPSTFVFWWTGSFDRNSTTAIDAFLVTLSRFLIPFTICNACRHQRIQITLRCMRSSGQAEEIHYKIQQDKEYAKYNNKIQDKCCEWLSCMLL